MGTHVLLNNIDHKDLKVSTDRSAALGDNVMSCVAYPNEFRNLQAHYPIVFARDGQSGQTVAVALLGLEKGENLFLSDQGWDNDYVPHALAMQPFLIGFSQGPDGRQQPVIHIDMDSPRIRDDGAPLFLPMGGHAPLLEQATAALEAVQQGHELNAGFVALLHKYDLLEPFVFDIELKDGSTNRLAGFHTINEEKLQGLDGSALADLNENGFLHAVYMAVASLSNFNELIRRKNNRLSGLAL